VKEDTMHARIGRWLAMLFTLGITLLLAGRTSAGDRDIFDYDGQQKAPKDVKKLVFIAATEGHGGRGNHEFMAGAIYLARTINANYPNAHAVVYTNKKWPTDLKHADAVIVLLNHGGPAVNTAIKEACGKGAGFMAIHYGVEVNKGDQGDNYLKWIGGYFETFWSVNPWWTPEFKEIPKHETTRGVKPFTINDEWYYHMRFVDGMKGVTPILAAVPPIKTVNWKEGQKPSSHGGNPDVFKEVSEGKAQVMAWAYDRPDGGRGFGFTGYHKHDNLSDDSFRTLLLNAVAWVSKLEVPENGVPSKTLTRDEREKLIDDGKLAIQRLVGGK
jgi:hypothetical protein